MASVAAAHGSSSWGGGGSHRASCTPLWLEANPNQALTMGCKACGAMLHNFDHVCVYIYLYISCTYIYTSPPAVLEDFHCLQELLQVRFLFLILLRNAGTPLPQKPGTIEACSVLPESWSPSPFPGEGHPLPWWVSRQPGMLPTCQQSQPQPPLF